MSSWGVGYVSSIEVNIRDSTGIPGYCRRCQYPGLFLWDSGDSFGWIVGVGNHGVISQSAIWNRGVGVPGMWSRSVGDVTVAAVTDTAAQLSAPLSLRAVINRTLQNLSLIIFSSLFAFKIFAHPLNRYALTYCDHNATKTKTVSRDVDRLSSSIRLRSNPKDELYAFRSNLTVLQKFAEQIASGDVIDVHAVGNIYVVSDVRRGVILRI